MLPTSLESSSGQGHISLTWSPSLCAHSDR